MSRVVTVEIAGQRYPIRSELEERYVTELAAYVDQKMRAASIRRRPATCSVWRCSSPSTSPTSSSASVSAITHANGELQERAMRLERIVDQALAQVAAKHGGLVALTGPRSHAKIP